MALTNEQKVEVLQEAACSYFRGLTTLSAWINFVNNVTKVQVKTFLRDAIESASDRFDEGSASLTAKASDYDDFSDEIDAL